MKVVLVEQRGKSRHSAEQNGNGRHSAAACKKKIMRSNMEKVDRAQQRGKKEIESIMDKVAIVEQHGKKRHTASAWKT